MPIKRTIPSEIQPFGGKLVFQWLVSEGGDTDFGDPTYFEFDASEIFPRYKCYLIFLDVLGVNGAWQLRVFTSLRQSSTSPPHRHRVVNQLQQVGITTTGKRELGANFYSGGNSLFAETLILEVDNTSCVVSPCALTMNADLVFYN